MLEEQLRNELIKKYQWAGKIRFVSFFLLFIFLQLLKFAGGYSYLNTALSALILIEAVLNQPYNFFLKRVNILRFQYHQMLTDIIAISWVMYYLGGIEAPVVSIAYYAVILWAGVVAGTQAVFFAVITSCVFLSAVVLLEHFGWLPRLYFVNSNMQAKQVFSLLIGNISFLFAFGYFSARSSNVVKFLQRKRQEESLKYTHKLIAAGYLLSSIAHDIINHLASIRGYAKILSAQIKEGVHNAEKLDDAVVLQQIEKLESENIELLSGLSRFSQRQEEVRQAADVNKVIEDALKLTAPLTRMSDINIERDFGEGLPRVLVDKNQTQEVLITLILNILGSITKKGSITIKTLFNAESNYIQIALVNPGVKKGQEYLKNPDEIGLGFNVAEEIIARNGGKIHIENSGDKGAAIIIQLPAA